MGGLGENASRRFAPVVGERAGADSVKTENALEHKKGRPLGAGPFLLEAKG